MLDFGSGTQALHYFILCFVSILSAIEISSTLHRRQDLSWSGSRAGLYLGALAIAACFIWFFWVDSEIFIPGLAGGEMTAIFVAAFALAVPTARGIAYLARLFRSTRWRGVSANGRQEASAGD